MLTQHQKIIVSIDAYDVLSQDDPRYAPLLQQVQAVVQQIYNTHRHVTCTIDVVQPPAKEL